MHRVVTAAEHTCMPLLIGSYSSSQALQHPGSYLQMKLCAKANCCHGAKTVMSHYRQDASLGPESLCSLARNSDWALQKKMLHSTTVVIASPGWVINSHCSNDASIAKLQPCPRCRQARVFTRLHSRAVVRVNLIKEHCFCSLLVKSLQPRGT